MRPARPSRRGSTMVEMSLLLLLIFSMLIAVMDFGQMLFFHQVMRERASAGARWAVVHSFSAADTSNVQKYVVYNTATPADGAKGLFGLNTSMVTVTPLPSASSMTSIEVSITFQIHLFTPGIARTFSKTFRSVRPVESLGATT